MISTSEKFNIYAPIDIKFKLLALIISLFLIIEKTFLGTFVDIKLVI